MRGGAWRAKVPLPAVGHESGRRVAGSFISPQSRTFPQEADSAGRL